jgi:hypothetical protein
MSESPGNEGIPDRYDLPEKALGGADAVPDTNYVPAADPGPEQRKGHGPGGATASADNRAVWGVIAFLIVSAVVVYLLGLLGIGQ